VRKISGCDVLMSFLQNLQLNNGECLCVCYLMRAELRIIAVCARSESLICYAKI